MSTPSSLPSAWPRPDHEPQGLTAAVTLFVFAQRPLELSMPVSRAHHGLPESFQFEALDLRQHLRSEARAWFEGFLAPEMLHVAELDLGTTAQSLLGMEVAYSLHLELLEPRDLAYLQGCWGAAKWLCECGAAFVHDAGAIRWHSAEHVAGLDPLRAFDVEHEVSVVFETDATARFGHVTHTRGLAKFGRPDVVLLGAQPEDATACGRLLNGLATRAAMGAALRDGQTVSPNFVPPRQLARYEPEGVHPQVHLNNDGLVLDVAGWGLGSLA